MSVNYLPVKDVAEQLGTTPKTVRLMCINGELEGAVPLRPDKNRSPWRIPETAIETWRRRRTTPYVPRPRKWREQALAY